MYDSIEEALSIIIRPKIKKIIVTINNGLSNFDNNFFIFSPIIIIAYFYSFENHIFII
jgi:hypothetical protein